MMRMGQEHLPRLAHARDRMRQEREATREARERERHHAERERERVHAIIAQQTLLLPPPKKTAGKRSWWRRWHSQSFPGSESSASCSDRLVTVHGVRYGSPSRGERGHAMSRGCHVRPARMPGCGAWPHLCLTSLGARRSRALARAPSRA